MQKSKSASFTFSVSELHVPFKPGNTYYVGAIIEGKTDAELKLQLCCTADNRAFARLLTLQNAKKLDILVGGQETSAEAMFQAAKAFFSETENKMNTDDIIKMHLDVEESEEKAEVTKRTLIAEKFTVKEDEKSSLDILLTGIGEMGPTEREAELKLCQGGVGTSCKQSGYCPTRVKEILCSLNANEYATVFEAVQQDKKTSTPAGPVMFVNAADLSVREGAARKFLCQLLFKAADLKKNKTILATQASQTSHAFLPGDRVMLSPTNVFGRPGGVVAQLQYNQHGYVGSIIVNVLSRVCDKFMCPAYDTADELEEIEIKDTGQSTGAKSYMLYTLTKVPIQSEVRRMFEVNDQVQVLADAGDMVILRSQTSEEDGKVGSIRMARSELHEYVNIDSAEMPDIEHNVVDVAVSPNEVFHNIMIGGRLLSAQSCLPIGRERDKSHCFSKEQVAHLYRTMTTKSSVYKLDEGQTRALYVEAILAHLCEDPKRFDYYNKMIPDLLKTMDEKDKATRKSRAERSLLRSMRK